MPDDKSYWFPAKRYGWGWGWPRTWQGWVVFALFTATVIALQFGLMPDRPLAFGLGTAVAAFALVAVCWLKGEPPRWRWGGDRR